MRYTIINFTRLGDLLQTQSTIAALKKSFLNIHDSYFTAKHSTQNNSQEILQSTSSSSTQNQISLICLEQFESAAHFIEELDDITLFTSTKILKSLQSDWRLAMQNLEIWVDAYYQKFPFEVIINLTPSMNCRIFAHLLSRKAPHIKLLGFGLDSFGYGQNSSVWTTYIQAVTKERGCSPYNLIDGFRSMLNLAPESFHLKKPSNELQKNAYNFLTQEKATFLKNTHIHKIAKEKKSFIAFQLGASNEVRQWDIQNFVQLGAMLWKQNYIPVLLGSHHDKYLAHAYIEASKKHNPNIPAINLCGKTTLEELGAVLTTVSALVSNDTGTLHLAVGLGTPVLGIYLATAQVFDTGPYGTGHLSLEPRLECHPCSFSHICEFEHKCRKSISAQTVFDALSFLLNSNNYKEDNEQLNIKTKPPLLSKDARVWQSYFDESGFINYHSLSGDENSNRTLWMACQRLFYKNFLERFSYIQNSTDNSSDLVKLRTIAKNKDSYNKDNILEKNFDYSNLNYQNTFLPLKDKLPIEENIRFIARVLSLILLLKEQATMLQMRPSVKLQENFLSSIERINTYLNQNSSFTALFLLWKNLIQEHSHSMESLIQFFDTLHEELSNFQSYLQYCTTLSE